MTLKRAEPGDYFKRHIYDLVIYGYALTKDEFLEGERLLGADVEELDYMSKSFDRWDKMGLVYGKCYSVACPDGEYGSTPKQATTAIPSAEFERAREHDWDT